MFLSRSYLKPFCVRRKKKKPPLSLCSDSCQTAAVGPDHRSSSSSSHSGSDGGNGKKVEVIDLTLDSSSEDEGQESPQPPPPPLPPPPKRACPSMSPSSPPVVNKGSDHLRAQEPWKSPSGNL